MVETQVNVWELRGIFEILSKLGVSNFAFKVEGRHVLIKVMNGSRTALVHVEGEMASDWMVEGYLAIDDPDLVLKAISRKSPHDWVRVRIDKDVSVEDIKVGAFYRSLKELKEARTRVETPEDVPKLELDFTAWVTVGETNKFRAFLREVEDMGGAVFIGYKEGEPYIGFMGGEMPYMTFKFRYAIDHFGIARAATTVGADLMVGAFPYTWFRSESAPTVKLEFGHALPVRISYTLSELNVAVYIAPRAEDEEILKDLLEGSPTAYKVPEDVVATFKFPSEILDKFSSIFNPNVFGFGVVFNVDRAELHAVDDSRTMAYFLSPAGSVLRGSAEGAFKLRRPIAYHLSVFTHLTTEAEVHVDSKGNVYLWSVNVGWLENEVYDMYKAAFKLFSDVYWHGRWSFGYETTVGELRRILSDVEKEFLGERKRRRWEPIFFVIDSDGMIYAYSAGEVKKLYGVRGESKDVPTKYCAIDVGCLRAALAPFKPSTPVTLYLSHHEKDREEALVLDISRSEYGPFAAVFASHMLTNEVLEKMGIVAKPTTPPAPPRLEERARELEGKSTEIGKRLTAYVDACSSYARSVGEFEERGWVEEKRKADLMSTFDRIVSELRTSVEELRRVEGEAERLNLTKLVEHVRTQIGEAGKLIKCFTELKERLERLPTKPPEKPPEKPAPPPKVTLPPEVKAYADSEIRKVPKVYRVDWYDTKVRVSIHKDSLEELKNVVTRMGGKVTAEIPARPPLVIVEADLSEVKPPAPRKPPVRPPTELTKEFAWDTFISEVRRLASERGVRVDEEDAKRYFEERWEEIKEVPRDRIEIVVKSMAADYVASITARPPTAPPAVPPAAPPAVAVPFDVRALMPDDRGFLLTFGVRRFIEEVGARYGLTLYDEHAVARSLADVMRSVGEEAMRTAKNLLTWQAGYWLYEGSPRFAMEGIYPALRYYWDDILAQLRRACWEWRVDVCPEDVKYVITDKAAYEVSGGRVWVLAVACRMYEIMGATPTDDLRAAKILVEKWVRERGRVVYAKFDEVGAVP